MNNGTAHMLQYFQLPPTTLVRTDSAVFVDGRVHESVNAAAIREMNFEYMKRKLCNVGPGMLWELYVHMSHE